MNTKKEETRVCQNCKKDFVIETEDFNFYEKIKVPPPTWCVECRQLRRYAWRNERTLYRRNCNLCGKSTVTIYSPNKPYKVYCNECWWGDGWDPASYGVDFDFSRPFFEQFHELQLEVPRMALLNKNSVNSEYANHASNNKNAYLSFSCFSSENIFYSNWIMKNSRDCVDCGFIYEKGERLYETIDSRTSYECQYCIFLKDCSSCYYCYDCHGCNECFMSNNLRNKSYVWCNQQLSREEYLKKKKGLELSSFVVRAGLLVEFHDLFKNNTIHRYVVSERNINSIGSLIYDCKNILESFEVNNGENCKYLYGVLDIKDCMDIYHAGPAELCYEIHGCTRTSNCQFCHLCYDNMNVMYSDTCQNSQNLFGCVSVKKGDYMIFNKKYLKADYQILKDKIIEHMKKTGEYGEFFPPEIAPVYYNETQGNLYEPMTKEEVLAKGWKWEDHTPGTFGKETIQSIFIPDRIEDVQDSYLREVFACTECSKNYNVVPNELLFYRKEKIPFPRKCPNCRYKRRFDLRPPRKLWHKKCMCDKQEHTNHLGFICKNEFETSYAPERPEKVYCESCYNKEVY
ncbi:MAG: hypothetical protein WCP17_00315 [bacterium]